MAERMPEKFSLSDKVRLKEDVSFPYLGHFVIAAKKGQEGSVYQVSDATGAIVFKYDAKGDMLEWKYFWVASEKIEHLD